MADDETSEPNEIGILSLLKVQNRYKHFYDRLTGDDFDTFLQKCDIDGETQKSFEEIKRCDEYVGKLQKTMQDTINSILKFNAELERRIKKDFFDDKKKNKGKSVSWAKSKEERERIFTISMQELNNLVRSCASTMKVIMKTRDLTIDAISEIANADAFFDMIKKQMDEEEKEEERRRREEEEKRRREEEEQRRKEEEERLKKEEEERLRKEEEERRSREEEEEKRRREEEERRRKEEEERRRRKEEEKRRRREEEEKRRREEEEERRKREEEEEERRRQEMLEEQERLRKEEEDRIRRDPRNWPLIIYKHGTGQSICVVRAMTSENLRKEDLMVTCTNDVSAIEGLDPSDEIISSVLRIEAAGPGADFEFEELWKVAVSHFAERDYVRELTIFELRADGTLVRMDSVEIEFEELPGVKFVETDIVMPSCTLFVVSRFKSRTVKIGREGGRVVSELDTRISIAFPMGAIHDVINVTLQVLPVESALLHDLRDRNDMLDNLITSSHMMDIEMPEEKSTKSVTYSVHLPHNPAKRKRPLTAAPVQTSMTTRPRTSYAEKKSSDDDEKIHIIIKAKDSTWKELNGIQIQIEKSGDVVSFQSRTMEPMRVMAFRTNENATDVSLSRMAKTIEDGFSDRWVHFLLRQNAEVKNDALIQAVLAHKLDRTLMQLEQDGYSHGPAASEKFLVKERQNFEISFRGNVGVDNQLGPMNLLFNTHLKNRFFFTLCVINPFGDYSFDAHRGFGQIFTQMIADNMVNNEDEQRKMERVLLCELSATLPKSSTAPRPALKAKFSMSKEVQDDFNYLCDNLADDWEEFARALGLKRPRIESIKRNHMTDDSSKDTIMEMLICWVKQIEKSASKTNILTAALRQCGRADLASELRKRDNRRKSPAK